MNYLKRWSDIHNAIKKAYENKAEESGDDEKIVKAYNTYMDQLLVADKDAL